MGRRKKGYNSLRDFEDSCVLLSDPSLRSVSSWIINPREIVERREKRQTIEGVMMMLSDREQQILRLRFIDGMTLAEIGHELGVSGNRIQQILSKALNKLRHPVPRNILLQADG